jgi:hypothetical protein
MMANLYSLVDLFGDSTSGSFSPDGTPTAAVPTSYLPANGSLLYSNGNPLEQADRRVRSGQYVVDTRYPQTQSNQITAFPAVDQGVSYLTPEEASRMNRNGVVHNTVKLNPVLAAKEQAKKDAYGNYIDKLQEHQNSVLANNNSNKARTPSAYVNPYAKMEELARYKYDDLMAGGTQPTQAVVDTAPSLAAQSPVYQQDVELQNRAFDAFTRRARMAAKHKNDLAATNEKALAKAEPPVVVGSGELAMRGGYKPVPAAVDRKASSEPTATMQYTTMAARPEVIAPTQELVDRSTPSLSNMKPVPDWARGTILEFTGQY